MPENTVRRSDASIPISVEDHWRLLGALIDTMISVAMFIVGIVAIVNFPKKPGHIISFTTAMLVMLGAWILDALLYALAVSLAGGSIGNLLTRRRVIDRTTGGRLTLGRSLLRYIGRRRLLAWYVGRARATPPTHQDHYVVVGDPTQMLGLAFAQRLRSPNPAATTVSVADRMAHSAVTRSRRRQ